MMDIRLKSENILKDKDTKVKLNYLKFEKNNTPKIKVTQRV